MRKFGQRIACALFSQSQAIQSRTAGQHSISYLATFIPQELVK
jgi:hypothetical protein